MCRSEKISQDKKSHWRVVYTKPCLRNPRYARHLAFPTDHMLTYIKIFMPFMFFHAFSNAFHNVFRGLKNSTQLLISTSLCSVASIILAFTLCPIMGIKGYYLQAALSWIIECIYIVIVYISGKWVPKPLRPMILGKKTSELSE